MSLFQSQRWPSAIVGIDPELLRQVYDEALAISDALPVHPTYKHVENMHERLGRYRALLRRVYAVSATPDAWPTDVTSDIELTLWCLGLARHISAQGGH